MNIKITKKDLKNNYYTIVRAGYCELQCLLKNSDAVREVGHACGLYGWNWTAYEVKASNGVSVCVCTGYRDLVGFKIEGISKFERECVDVWDCYDLDYNTKNKSIKK